MATWTSYYWLWIYDSDKGINDYIGKEDIKNFSFKSSIAGEGYAPGGCVASELKIRLYNQEKISLIKTAVANKSKYLYIYLNAAETKPTATNWWQGASSDKKIASLYVVDIKENVINNMAVADITFQDIFCKLDGFMQDASAGTFTAQQLMTQALQYKDGNNQTQNITTINDDISSWTLELNRTDLTRREILYNICEIYNCYCRATYNRTLEVRKMSKKTSGDTYKKIQKSDVFDFEQESRITRIDGVELTASDNSSTKKTVRVGYTSSDKLAVFKVDKNPFVLASNINSIASKMRYNMFGPTKHTRAKIPFSVGIAPGTTIGIYQGSSTKITDMLITSLRWDGEATCEIEEDNLQNVIYDSELEQ